MSKPIIPHIIYRANYPFSLYVLGLLLSIAAILAIIFGWNLLAVSIYASVFAGLFYVFFLRFSAKIIIDTDLQLSIDYLFPWNRNVRLDLRSFNSFDYAWGFYDPFEDRKLGYLSFLRVSYDLIILSNAKRQITKEFKVNFRMGTFRNVINILSKEASLQLIKLQTSKQIIW